MVEVQNWRGLPKVGDRFADDELYPDGTSILLCPWCERHLNAFVPGELDHLTESELDELLDDLDKRILDHIGQHHRARFLLWTVLGWRWPVRALLGGDL